MNLKTILKPGIIAGIIIIVSATTMVPVVGNEMNLALAKFNLPPLSVADMMFFFAVSLFNGMMLMWLYSILFPIYRKRIKVILISVLIIWLPSYLIANFANVVYGFMPVGLTVIGVVWGFAELLVAGLIGSRYLICNLN